MINFLAKYKKTISLSVLIFSFTFLIPQKTHAAGGSILSGLLPDSKRCKYIQNSEYELFSDINPNFALFQALGAKGNGGCVQVVGSVNTFFDAFFKIFIGIASVLAIIRIAVGGIKTMLSESSAKIKSEWKSTVTSSLEGLLIALVSWLLLNTINDRTLKQGFSFKGVSNLTQGIAQGEQDAAIAAAQFEAQQAALAAYREANPSNPDLEGVGQGTGDASGSTSKGSATIFGYRDGNGMTGDEGDNGLGNAAYSDIAGYTNFTGDPSSLGVAVPKSQMAAECGGDPRKCGYEIFHNGQSLGVFPIVDESKENLDLSYGLVKNFIDDKVQDSNSWSSNKITYKALPGYYNTNPKPQNPYVKDIPAFGNKASAGQVAQAIANGQADVIRK